MSGSPDLSWHLDPLALDPGWPSPVPLLSLHQALEETVFRSGLSREAWLRRLAAQFNRASLLPLLWLLPRGWRLAPADLPPRLQSLAMLVQEGLLSPQLLAALVDDLPHLLPSAGSGSGALALWCSDAVIWQGQSLSLPATAAAFEALLAEAAAEANAEDASAALATAAVHQPTPAAVSSETLLGGLILRNLGLPYSQVASARRLNTLAAQLLNRLAGNRHNGAPAWCFEGCWSGRQWLNWLQARGWSVSARLRASIASFGLGACLPADGGTARGWRQVPLGLPLRTGLLDPHGEEAVALLPHTALELSLEHGEGALLRLQYYQGNEGFCGWKPLNDLHRPWQNDSGNGTVRYVGSVFRDQRLLELIDLTEVMALIHNRLASTLALPYGGYGCLGFCIDTTALLQQAMEATCSVFPVLLTGIWRERLLRQSDAWLAECASAAAPDAGALLALERYRQALQALPLDLSHHGVGQRDAWGRLRACQPSSSPFLLVQRHQAHSCAAAGAHPGSTGSRSSTASTTAWR